MYGFFDMRNNHSSKWIFQRITAVLLIPLTFWFIYQCVSFQKVTYLELEIFFQSYLNSFLFLIMMISMLIHAKLGCDTIIQDYISTTSFIKIFKIIINYITFFSLILVIVAIIKMSLF